MVTAWLLLITENISAKSGTRPMWWGTIKLIWTCVLGYLTLFLLNVSQTIGAKSQRARLIDSYETKA